LKKRYTLLVISAWLILLLTACAKQEIKQMVTPFVNIPISTAKSVEFANYTITSKNKELGRIKTVTDRQDMENIVKYIKTVSCTESTKKIEDGDYQISLNKEKGDYEYSIVVSKNQISMTGGKADPTEHVYEYKDPKLINELARIYNEMNYKEILIGKK